MDVNAKVLEHEILKVLYNHGILTIRAQGTLSEGHQPIYKKIYEHSTFYFGTLVDILNNPEKYDPSKIQEDEIMNIKSLKKTIENVDITKYEWGEVSDAIEILAANNHVKDNLVGESYLEAENRKITLTQQGALVYRSKHYIKEAKAELSLELQFEILKKELWQKKYWIVVEISKYLVGGIIGALIALATAPNNKSEEQKQENKQIVPTGFQQKPATFSQGK